MVYRIFIANTTARAVAEIGSAQGLAGTVSEATGFGSWGIEPTVVAEIGGVTPKEIEDFVAAIFESLPKEEAVYVIAGATGKTWWRDGRKE